MDLLYVLLGLFEKYQAFAALLRTAITLIPWPLGDMGVILRIQFTILFY